MRHTVDRHAPVGTALGDGSSNRVVQLGLRPVAGRARALEQAIDQDARAAVAV